MLWAVWSGLRVQPLATARELVEVVQNRAVLAEDVGNISRVLATLTAGTSFVGHVRVNQPVDESSLNFFLLSRNPADRRNFPAIIMASKILGNCAFVGIANTIVCDSQLVDEFLSDPRVFQEVPDAPLEAAKRDYQTAFLAWLLGHELGHVVAGGAAHFGQSRVLEAKMPAAIELSPQAETAADLFAAKKIETDKRLTNALEGLLTALIDQEVAEKNGKSAAYGVGLHWDYANKRVIQYFANQDHPEFVIRATRMLALIAADTHEEALQALIETFSRHLVGVDANAQ